MVTGKPKTEERLKESGSDRKQDKKETSEAPQSQATEK